MASSPDQVPPGGEGIHLVLYDGVCGLCNRLPQFLLEHDRRAAFDFAPLQSSTAKALVDRFGGNADDMTSFYVLANYRTGHARVLSRSAAAVFVAGEPGWPLTIAVLAPCVPP